MLKKFKYNQWLIGFIVIGLIAALSVGFYRHKIEESNTTVEMVIDYEGLVELAQIEGLSVNEVFKNAKQSGITSLAVYETTLKKLAENGKVTTTAGADLIKNYNNGTLSDPAWRTLVSNGSVNADNIYLTSLQPQIFAEVKADLIRRLGENRVQSIKVGAVEVVAVKANYEKAMKLNLGMPTDEMKAVNDAGFYVVARPSNYAKVTEEDIQSVFDRLDGFKISDVIFSGEEILGAPKNVKDTAPLFKSRDYTLGMIEHPLQLQFFKQEGLMELAKDLEYKAARVYSIPKDEQPKLKVAEAVERWGTTDEERNIRINLLRTYEKPEGTMSLFETNMKYFADTTKELKNKGFSIGKAGTYENYYPSPFLLILITLGAAAAGVLYVSLVYPFKERYQYLLMASISIVLVTPILLGHGNTVRSVVALASANLFPALAVIWQLDRWRENEFDAKTPIIKIMLTGVVLLLTTGALAFIGGAYVGSVLADVEYLLEVNIFRGVKLTFIMPIVLVSLAFLTRFNLFEGKDYSGNLWTQIKRILNTPIYVKSLVGFGIAAVVAFIFIGRSGHTAGIPVSVTELKFRAFLEQALYARPRSKELLIGHPAFMLTVLAVYKKWPRILFFILVIVATIGQGSLVETFCHLRTPIFMSFMRGVGGLIFGAGVGVIAMLAAHFLYNLSSYIGRDTTKHE
ncbi:MAG: hypothetical protein H6Q70_4711 [Firmicutes bacterium]|nr:hypothetical protein [Bacillota bacterium]